ncbi:hypothetical protein [Campylobacter sputorum]|uniref:hypothetical protein n=1 Tax=Campylobacter sputorum TaxID=206 RepID=UPI00053BF175|nr:hypothetical protein [Campylobacter sputorum]
MNEVLAKYRCKNLKDLAINKEERSIELQDRADVMENVIGLKAWAEFGQRGYILISKRRYKELNLMANANKRFAGSCDRMAVELKKMADAYKRFATLLDHMEAR